MAAAYKVIDAQHGSIDPDKTMEIVKSLKFESPRGPIAIDPATRDIILNAYFMRAERRNGVLGNYEFPDHADGEGSAGMTVSAPVRRPFATDELRIEGRAKTSGAAKYAADATRARACYGRRSFRAPSRMPALPASTNRRRSRCRACTRC